MFVKEALAADTGERVGDGEFKARAIGRCQCNVTVRLEEHTTGRESTGLNLMHHIPKAVIRHE